MSAKRFTMIAAVLASVAACAAQNQTGIRPDSRHTISGSDIVAVGGYSALDGIRLVRPAGLSPRDLGSPRRPGGDPPVVYLDGVKLRSVDTLGDVHPLDVESMQFLDALTATTRFGTGHTGGALLVKTRFGN